MTLDVHLHILMQNSVQRLHRQIHGWVFCNNFQDVTLRLTTGIDICAPHSGGGNLELLWKNAQISHNFDDHERAVREMVRVIKPGGKFVIWDITHMVEATAQKMRSMGIECEVKPTNRKLGFDMSMVIGQKTES